MRMQRVGPGRGCAARRNLPNLGRVALRGIASMSNVETPSTRYGSLAQECIEVANAFPPGEERNALLELAEVWQRLADHYAHATPPFRLGAAEQPVMQQQEQVQPKGEGETS